MISLAFVFFFLIFMMARFAGWAWRAGDSDFMAAESKRKAWKKWWNYATPKQLRDMAEVVRRKGEHDLAYNLEYEASRRRG